jgi:DNA-binding beta-propeller fold protein YncE
MNRLRRLASHLACLGIACLASTAAAVEHTHDGVVELESAQISGTSDGFNPGKQWTGALFLPAPVTLNAGDTIQGSVGFGARLLRISDHGGGFFKVGMTTGFEQLIATAVMPGVPNSLSQQDTTLRVVDVRGPAAQLGGTRRGGINHNGMLAQVTTNLTSTDGSILVSGVTYRLRLVSGGPFTFDKIGLRVLGEELAVEPRPSSDIAWRGCVTGETLSGPGGTDACTTVPSVMPEGEASGLESLRAVVVSPDGTSVYAAAALDHAVVRFDRDAETGGIAFRNCLTGTTDIRPACTEIPGATPTGEDSGLDLVHALAISPDGTSLYAVSPSDDAVMRFERDPATGDLTFGDCLTGEMPATDNECRPIPNASTNGDDSGIDRPFAMAVSADGTSAYVASFEDDAVVHFDRDPATGALTYRGCITGEAESGPSGTDACVAIDTATSGGEGSGLDGPYALALSPDGTSLYVAAPGDDAVARFDRDPATGALTYRDCMTGETGVDACTPIQSATIDGADSGLDDVAALAVSPDGSSLYTVASNDDAVARFTRDVTTGALTFDDCITGEHESGAACTEVATATERGARSGLDRAFSIVVAPDGSTVHVAAVFDHAVTTFERDALTGALTPQGCLTGELGFLTSHPCARVGSAQASGTHSGIDSPAALAISADGRSLYTASAQDAAVGRFDRLLPPPPTTTTLATTTTTTSSSSTTVTSSSRPSSTLPPTTTTTSTSSTTTTTIAVLPIGAAQLVIIDHPDATKRKIVFSSNDPRIVPKVPTVEDGIDPTSDGAVLQVYNAAGSDDHACFSLPASEWVATVKRSRTTLKYTDEGATVGPCKMVLIKGGKLTLTCTARSRPIDYSLDEPTQQKVAVRFRSGATEYCALFGGTVVKDSAGKKFVAKNATMPTACPTPPSPCS